MASSILSGTPQKATSYTTSSTETPKWMQDAIYNQIQMAQQTAAIPYQDFIPGVGETSTAVAQLSPLQQQALTQVKAAQGQYAPTVAAAQQKLSGLSTQGTAAALNTAQNQYLAPGNVAGNLNSGQGLYGQAAGLNVATAANPYLSQAANQNIMGAANPYLSQAGQATGQAASGSDLQAASPYLTQSANTNITGAASPYLNQAGQSSVQDIGSYMNPYQQNVLDTLAKQGTRNLTENLLPGVSDAFIKAGQFGSNRMGEFGERAVRDTQEAILNAQSTAAQQGYSQALTASQADLARQAQLGQTAGQLASSQAQNLANVGQTTGQLSSADLARTLQAGAQYGTLGQTAGQLTGQQQQNIADIGKTAGQVTSQQAQNLANLGQQYTTAGQTQQQYGINAAQAGQVASAADLARQQSVLGQMVDTAKTQQGMTYADTAALSAAGADQQAQNQAQLTALKAEFDKTNAYPQTQLDWLNTQVRGMTSSVPTTTTTSNATSGATYSPSIMALLAGVASTAKGTGLV